MNKTCNIKITISRVSLVSETLEKNLGEVQIKFLFRARETKIPKVSFGTCKNGQEEVP